MVEIQQCHMAMIHQVKMLPLSTTLDSETDASTTLVECPWQMQVANHIFTHLAAVARLQQMAALLQWLPQPPQMVPLLGQWPGVHWGPVSRNQDPDQMVWAFRIQVSVDIPQLFPEMEAWRKFGFRRTVRLCEITTNFCKNYWIMWWIFRFSMCWDSLWQYSVLQTSVPALSKAADTTFGLEV